MSALSLGRQHNDRNGSPVRTLLICGKADVEIRCAAPIYLPLGWSCFASEVCAATTGQLKRSFRMGAQVMVPGRMMYLPKI
jgi:hypothetical protein